MNLSFDPLLTQSFTHIHTHSHHLIIIYTIVHASIINQLNNPSFSLAFKTTINLPAEQFSILFIYLF